MYAKAFLVALLSLALSANAAPSPSKSSEQCETAAAQAVTKTVTVTATAVSTAALASTGKGGDNAASSSTGSTDASTGTADSAQAAASALASASAKILAAQSALTIDPSNVFDYSADGSVNATAGQELSQTSKNNFINFCMIYPNLPHTNGQQIVTGSCNQTPMGAIAAQTKMPSAKFQSPTNGATVAANTNFTIAIALANLETGHFTNADSTYHMAPQVLNDAGVIKGHSHVTVEQISSLDSTTVSDASKFVFFKGLNAVADANGVLSTVVPGGLPAGTYKVSTINSAANHQPALVAVAQRGSLDDVVYFTVSDSGAAASTGTGAAAAASSSAATGTGAAAAASSSAAAAKTASKGNNQSAAAAAAAAKAKAAAAKGQGKNRRSF